MSSFVIDKSEYIKAAGLIAGLLYEDHDRGDILEFFNKAWRYNAMSVQEQYGDEECEQDDCEYMDEFHKALEIAQRSYCAGSKYQTLDIIDCLSMFFCCALYQTENEEYAGELAQVFVRYLGRMLTTYCGHATDANGWWGTINIKELKGGVQLQELKTA